MRDSLPRSPSGRYIDWPVIVEAARRKPGWWVLRYNDVSQSVARAIDNRSTAALRLEDGKLEAEMINRYVDEHGLRRGDMYVRYIPYADR